VPQARAAARAKPEATEQTAQVGEQFIDEVSLLHRARRLVIAQPEAALALTTLHAEQHPGGLFREEREALHIEALWRLQREEEAQRAFAEFTRDFPRSTYRPRLSSQLRE